MKKIEEGTCLTCLGTGEVSSERGLARCDDCDGSGKIGTTFDRNEQRMRQIEAKVSRLGGETEQDVRWLIGELRRARSSLLSIMSLAQEGGLDEESLKRVRFFA